VLCTGNLTSNEVTVWLKSLCSDVVCVEGDLDQQGGLPEVATKEVGGWSIGVIHGYQVVPWGSKGALADRQRELGVDLLLHGHSDSFELVNEGGVRLLCPGSACEGAQSGSGPPSFVVLNVESPDRIEVYHYQLAGEGAAKPFSHKKIEILRST